MSSSTSPQIRILIVDDVEHVRQGLRNILHLYEDLEVVGEARDGFEAIRLAEALRPDVALMDLEMPGLGGLEATRRIKEQQPMIGIVIITIHDGKEIQERAMQAGADVFVGKEAPTENLIAAIRHIRTAIHPKSEGDNNEP